LFIACIVLAGDLVTVLYYFLDGQEMTIGFLLKIVSVLAVSLIVFVYYISDIRNKLNSKSRKIWLSVSILLILISIVWGFSVIGSPQTQRLLKYDEQKVSNLTEINYQIVDYWQQKNVLPSAITDLSNANNYFVAPIDPQDNSPYEYRKTGNLSYELCATFNKTTKGMEEETNISALSRGTSWNHPAGQYCFTQTINPNLYQNGVKSAVPVAN
jgi:hypothetical protein